MEKAKKKKVTFLIEETLYEEYKKHLREEGKIPTSDLNKYIRDYVSKMKSYE